ncbi:transposase [Frigoriglobus tundricola]|uniref:transposase n=1 Tax=Frigoriglobus tundricola TaxID=2774151 RepID=UPI00148EA53F|nr:transposase [Frigoriglobus tundricola]
MVQRLGSAVPDLGRHTAGDSTGLRGRPEPDAGRRETETTDGLPQASGGRKEYKDDGKVTKVVEWFGYTVHLLVDVTHEVVLSYRITGTKTGANECIETLVEGLKRSTCVGSRRSHARPRNSRNGTRGARASSG